VIARSARVDEARLAVALAREADDLDGLPAAAELERAWETMSTTQRRALLGRVIDCAFVSRGHLPVRDRVTICPKGTAPNDLPHGGDKRCRAHTFRPRETRRRGAVGTRPAHRWTNARLERELRAFVAERGEWPVPSVFVCAGRGELLQQARLLARDQWWAFRLGVPMQNPPGAGRPWTDERIYAELADYLDGTTVWPTAAQFRADGHGTLREVIGRHGGVRRWAPRFAAVACPQIRRWTDEAIRRELTVLCRGRSTFPSQGDLTQLRLSGLDEALARSHGRRWWAAQVGLQLPHPGPRRRPRPAG
jgi:hypothetical protein